MARYSRLLVSALAAFVLCSPVPAQQGGGGLGGAVGGVTGGIGGAVGGITGGVGGAAGGALGGIGGTAGGALGGIGGAAGGALGGIGGGIGRIGSGVTGIGGNGPGSLAGTLTQSQLGEMMSAIDLNRVYVDASISTWGPDVLADVRLQRLRALIDENRATLDRDDNGLPVRRYELIATNPDAVSLGAAARAGFGIARDEVIRELGIRVVTLAIPRKMNVRQAMKSLRRAAPALQVDYNHVYEPAGGALLPAAGAALAGAVPGRGRLRIAMVDGGVAAHPALRRASIEQNGFAGSPQPTGHGTAVGSLLVGEQGPFRARRSALCRRRLRRQAGGRIGDDDRPGTCLGRVEAAGGRQHQPGGARQRCARSGSRGAWRQGNRGHRGRRQRWSSSAAPISRFLSRRNFGDRSRRAGASAPGGRQGRRPRFRGAGRGHGRRTSWQRVYARPRDQLRGTARRRSDGDRRVLPASRRRSPSGQGSSRARNRLRPVPDRSEAVSPGLILGNPQAG